PSNDQWAPLLADVGLSKPVIRLKNVVLPAPLGPINAVMTPRWTSRWSTSTAVMPPKERTMLSTLRIGSGLAEPGSGVTPAIRARRCSGSALSKLTLPVFVSDIEPQLSLVAEDSLGFEDHQQ